MPICLPNTVLKDEEEEEGKDKGGEDQLVVTPLQDKMPTLFFCADASLGCMRCF